MSPYETNLEDEEEGVSITGQFKHQTDQAILIDYDGDDLWVPKSVIIDQLSTGNYRPFSLLELEVKEWWAIKNELC